MPIFLHFFFNICFDTVSESENRPLILRQERSFVYHQTKYASFELSLHSSNHKPTVNLSSLSVK